MVNSQNGVLTLAGKNKLFDIYVLTWICLPNIM